MENETATEAATRMAVLDAIQRGISKEQLMEYVKTEAFNQAVIDYKQMFSSL